MFIKQMAKATWKFLSLLSYVITISVIYGLTEDTLAKLEIFKKYWYILGLLWLTIVIITILFYLKKHKEKEYSSKKIHDISHNIRNYTISNTQGNTVKDLFAKICTSICQDISAFAQNEYKRKFGVSIKTLSTWPKEPNEKDVLNTPVATLCRAGDNARKRLEDDKARGDRSVYVKDNTAFERILLGNKTHDGIIDTTFACSNLPMLNRIWKITKQALYVNPHEDYIKVYKSTIVVPIRVYNDNMSVFNNSECYNNYKTYGFLCIDSPKTMSKAEKDELLEYMCSFADNLCVLFNVLFKNDSIIPYETTNANTNSEV